MPSACTWLRLVEQIAARVVPGMELGGAGGPSLVVVCQGSDGIGSLLPTWP